MHEIENDCFYDFVKQYDPDIEHHFVGEVDYHLLTDNKNYEVLQSHREALIAVFDHMHPLAYDIDKAQPMMLDPHDFFYCPNIVKTDYYGNVSYDAKWRPDDDNIGTTVRSRETRHAENSVRSMVAASYGIIIFEPSGHLIGWLFNLSFIGHFVLHDMAVEATFRMC